jgi:hypothetical protein
MTPTTAAGPGNRSQESGKGRVIMADHAERYVDEVIRSLPPAQQDDVRRELTASIADDVEARTEQGEAPGDAERAVLMALGDPQALAAGYADRPLHLIGPRYYLTWWRLLKLLWAIVIPCAAGGVVIGQLIAGEGVGVIIGQTIGIGASVAVHLAFWVTLVFSILDRAGADAVEPWTPDRLPEVRPSGAGRADLIASLVMAGIFAGVVLWDRFIGLVWLGGRPWTILDQGFWPWGATWLLTVIALTALLAIAVFIRRRWTLGLAAVNAVLSLAFAVPATWLLATDRLMNVELLADYVPDDAVLALKVVLGAFIVGIAIWSIIDSFLKARRAGRSR